MKKIFTSIAMFLCFAAFVNAQETVMVKLNCAWGGSKLINGESNSRLAVTKGSLVTLSGEALNENAKFAFFTINKSWENGGTIVSNKNPYQFVAEEDVTYYINYVEKSEDLTATVETTATDGGSIKTGKPNGYQFMLGDEINLEAKANDGYKFVNWTDANGNEISAEEAFDAVVTEKNMTFKANFEATTGEGGEDVEGGEEEKGDEEVEGDNETAIENVEEEASQASSVIYDLCGRRVNEITNAGIYIINGKKVVVK